MRALVVEDSTTIRSILRKILTELGFEVLEAPDGQEALQRLKDAPKIDVALVDWNMPEMNGYDFVQAVRKNHSHDLMRIIMVTTETEIIQVSKALEAGANEYVMKPFTKDMIAEKLTLLGIALS
jgi:two-component system chemotaxis response regulator CheY